MVGSGVFLSLSLSSSFFFFVANIWGGGGGIMWVKNGRRGVEGLELQIPGGDWLWWCEVGNS